MSAPGVAPGQQNRQPRLRDLPREDPSQRTRLLSSTARAVYGILCEYANSDQKMWPAWVSRSRSGWAAWPSVAAVCGLSGFRPRAVQLALRQLESRKAIQRISDARGGAPGQVDGKWQPARTNAYLITPHLVQGSAAENPAYNDREPRISRQRTLHITTENPAPHAPYLFKDLPKDEANNSPKVDAAANQVDDRQLSVLAVKPERAHPPSLKPKTPEEDPGYAELLDEARRVEMRAGFEELIRLYAGPWQEITPEQKQAAIVGLQVRRESGEYRDPAYVPTLATYLREHRWERPLKAKPLSTAEKRQRASSVRQRPSYATALANGDVRDLEDYKLKYPGVNAGW